MPPQAIKISESDDVLDLTGLERVYDSILDLIPNPNNPTPMIRLSERFNPNRSFEMLLKLEGLNPFGSIKDRTAFYMLKDLRLKADQSLVEPSAGNTGIALAAMANAQGTRHRDSGS